MANPDFATVTAGVSYSGNLLANDVDSNGWPLWVMANSQPQHGSLSVDSDGNFTYIADSAYSGQDGFTYEAYNGPETAWGTVTITVNAGSGGSGESYPPSGSPDSYSINAGATLLVGAPGVLANDSDPDGDPLTVTGTVAGPYNGQLSVNGDGSFEYLPNTGFSGSDSFSYMLSDGYASDGPIMVTITVSGGSGGNHPPQGSADSYSVNAGQTLTVSAPGVLGNDTDPDGDPLSAALVSGASHGTASLNGDGSFSYTPAASFTGTDSFTYTVSDGQASDGPITVMITVSGSIGGNHPPQGSPDSYSVSAGQTLTVSAPGLLANDTDPDGDALSVASSGSPSHGTQSISADGWFSYTPDAGFTGTDSFPYYVTDGQATDGPITVTITVSSSIGGNYPPIGCSDSYQVVHDHSLSIAAPGVLSNDSDPDGDVIAIASYSEPDNGSLSLASDGSFTYVPDSHYLGNDSFTYTITDGQSTSGTVTVSIVVWNYPPTVMDEWYTVQFDQTLAGNVLANDSDVDGDLLTAQLSAAPQHGTLAFSGNGNFVYTPDPDYSGDSDSFGYQVSDGIAQVAGTAYISITHPIFTAVVRVSNQGSGDIFITWNGGSATVLANHSYLLVATSITDLDFAGSLLLVSPTTLEATGNMRVTNGVSRFRVGGTMQGVSLRIGGNIAQTMFVSGRPQDNFALHLDLLRVGGNIGLEFGVGGNARIDQFRIAGNSGPLVDIGGDFVSSMRVGGNAQRIVVGGNWVIPDNVEGDLLNVAGTVDSIGIGRNLGAALLNPGGAVTPPARVIASSFNSIAAQWIASDIETTGAAPGPQDGNIGSITARDVSGNVTTANGDIRLLNIARELSGSVSAHAGNNGRRGDIYRIRADSITSPLIHADNAVGQIFCTTISAQTRIELQMGGNVTGEEPDLTLESDGSPLTITVSGGTLRSRVVFSSVGSNAPFVWQDGFAFLELIDQSQYSLWLFSSNAPALASTVSFGVSALSGSFDVLWWNFTTSGTAMVLWQPLP